MQGNMGIREVAVRFDHLVDRIQAGDVITLTDHGRPVARVVPIETDDEHHCILHRTELTGGVGSDRYLREDWAEA